MSLYDKQSKEGKWWTRDDGESFDILSTRGHFGKDSIREAYQAGGSNTVACTTVQRSGYCNWGIHLGSTVLYNTFCCIHLNCPLS